MRTPLSRVLYLGSAHDGTTHFWRQRVTALANIPLTIAFIVILILVIGEPQARVVAVLSAPLVDVLLFLMIVSIAIHMRLGMQVIVEDYVHGHLLRPLLLAANTFFAAAVVAIAGFALIRLAVAPPVFGG
ncbi:MAG TPA: succinate dehydrogenase, hydrophobic membrane anchor protein [Bauldia sp.]|nr:succinate dehydrogenase, hydrophobic membrane anchor protein [Bauldia sp.]